MTDHGTYITVEASELPDHLDEVIAAIEHGRSVRLERSGRPLAEICAPPAESKLPYFPELAPLHVADDAFATTDEDEWPMECR